MPCTSHVVATRQISIPFCVCKGLARTVSKQDKARQIYIHSTFRQMLLRADIVTRTCLHLTFVSYISSCM